MSLSPETHPTLILCCQGLWKMLQDGSGSVIGWRLLLWVVRNGSWAIVIWVAAERSESGREWPGGLDMPWPWPILPISHARIHLKFSCTPRISWKALEQWPQLGHGIVSAVMSRLVLILHDSSLNCTWSVEVGVAVGLRTAFLCRIGWLVTNRDNFQSRFSSLPCRVAVGRIGLQKIRSEMKWLKICLNTDVWKDLFRDFEWFSLLLVQGRVSPLDSLHAAGSEKSMLLEVLPGTDLNDAAKKEETQNDSWNPPEGSALHDFFVVPVFAAFSLYVVNVFAFSSA